MHPMSRLTGVITAVVLASSPGASAVLAQADPQVTLRFAVEDAADEIGHPYINAFIEHVAALSDGSIAIEPEFDDDGWDATDGPLLDLEAIRARPFGNEEVLRRVGAGEAELGMVRATSLGWETLGVTSLRALGTPYLIDSLGLAVAVSQGDIAARALGGLSSAGLTGLAILPQDLFHPFSWTPGHPFRSPADYAGAAVRLFPSSDHWALIRALGATPWYMNNYVGTEVPGTAHGLDVGLRSYGALGGDPTNTGNVTPHARLQVLVVRSDVLERLTTGQQQALRDAAALTREGVIAEHPTEADLAVEWCNQGHSVVLASADQLAQLEAAAQPVIDAISADPLAAALIADIRALKASVEPGPQAAACEPAPQPTMLPVDTTGYLATAIPNGSYRADLTVDVLVEAGADAGWAARNAGVTTFDFTDGLVTMTVDGGQPCRGTATLIEGGTELATGPTEPCGLGGVVQWKPDAAGIRLLLVGGVDPSDPEYADYAAWINRLWTRVE